jgi:hypothetical protein
MEPIDRSFRARAAELGEEAGKAAASWVFDGNTSHATYRAFLDRYEDGDDLDAYAPRSGWLSGEFAESPTPGTLARDLGVSADSDILDDACEVFETTADDAYWAELLRVATHQAGGDE